MPLLWQIHLFAAVYAFRDIPIYDGIGMRRFHVLRFCYIHSTVWTLSGVYAIEKACAASICGGYNIERGTTECKAMAIAADCTNIRDIRIGNHTG